MECSTPPSTEQTLPHNHTKPMKNFHDFVLKLAQARPNAPLSPPAQTLLRDRLESFASQYRTPDHPPYSAMILNALEELNEKGGSKEESISQYLQKKYDNLPWAHSALLEHHLEKSCASGDIVVTHAKKYRLAESPDSSTETNRKPPLKRKLRRECKKGKHNPGKSRPRKKRKQQKGKNVEVITKHQECDEKEDPIFLLTHPPSTVVSDNEKERHEEVVRSEIEICAAHSQEHQESEKSDHSQSESATPERPPGFESVRVENLPQLGLPEPKPASSEEDTTLRQLKHGILKIRFLCKKQPLKDAFVNGLEDPQKETMLLKQKPNVDNLEAVDDCREQDFEQSRKDAECSSINEKMEPSKAHLPEGPKRQRIGRPPRRRSARLLGAKMKPSYNA